MDVRKIQYKNGVPFFPVTFPLSDANGILVQDLQIEKIVDYINIHKIKGAYICDVKNYDFLNQCQDVEAVVIELKTPLQYYETFIKRGNKRIRIYDVEPIHILQHLKSLAIIDMELPSVESEFNLDLSVYAELQRFEGDCRFVRNLEKAIELKTVFISNYKESSLEKISTLHKLDTLNVSTSKIKSLSGCKEMHRLQCLYLSHNRALVDINELRYVKKTLKALRIDKCPKIEDFSVLRELENLELLELTGSNSIQSLDFLKCMKNLKTFIFDINVIDGDLSLCKGLSYVYCDRCKKHYNLKEKDMPKGIYVRGNEDIEMWRRLE